MEGQSAGAGHGVSDRIVFNMNLDSFSEAPPPEKLRLLFIHHSCGGQLLAEAGSEQPLGPCLYRSHPNGGGLRSRLEAQGYEIHQASYGSAVGEKTDLFDWLPKFRQQMDQILNVDQNDRAYPDGGRNQIVIWKSCFPNNLLRKVGDPPGDPAGPALTIWNARSTLTAVLSELAKHPEVLFVYVTAPPVAEGSLRSSPWRRAARVLLGSPTPSRMAALARQFNSWVVSPSGWLQDYPARNVAVFDYFDLLTDQGASDFSRYPTGKGADSHPSRAGNQRAAAAFGGFLNRAVRRAGLGTGAPA
jgi:hypothetical protein